MFSFLAVFILGIGYAQADLNCTMHRPIKPVCGSNGQVYYNECYMKEEAAAQKTENVVHTVAWEQCLSTDCFQMCTRERDPVCGSDGEISGNPCTFLWYSACGKKEQIYEADMETCLSKKCPQQCAPNDEKCSKELSSCRFTWSGKS